VSVNASLSDNKLNLLIQRENELTAKDKALRERSDRRNALEEFTYSAKDNIQYQLKEYSTEAFVLLIKYYMMTMK
jgi:molecular chaperone DnaK (HSP70)